MLKPSFSTLDCQAVYKDRERITMREVEMDRLARMAQEPKPRRSFPFLMKIWRRMGASKPQSVAPILEAHSRPLA